jgi:hypothetical protein
MVCETLCVWGLKMSLLYWLLSWLTNFPSACFNPVNKKQSILFVKFSYLSIVKKFALQIKTSIQNALCRNQTCTRSNIRLTHAHILRLDPPIIKALLWQLPQRKSLQKSAKTPIVWGRNLWALLGLYTSIRILNGFKTRNKRWPDPRWLWCVVLTFGMYRILASTSKVKKIDSLVLKWYLHHFSCLWSALHDSSP